MCVEVFQDPSFIDPSILISDKLMETPYSNDYAGQGEVGKEYAVYKEMLLAKMPPNFSVDKLSKSEKQKLLKSVYKDFEKNPLPAVRDPQGRIFLLDGHHGVYVATLLQPEKSKIFIKIRLVYDAYNTSLSMNDFIATATTQNWFYGDENSILTQPLQVHELKNSVERSMMGMLFLYILDTYDVPMKGKHFTPFVQFYLIDLIKQEGLFTFPETFQNSQVPRLANVLMSTPDVLIFWLNHLRPTAPEKLRKFLNNALVDALSAHNLSVPN